MKKKTALIYFALFITTAAIGFACFAFVKKYFDDFTNVISETQIPEKQADTIIPQEKEPKENYIRETNYKGALLNYPELYEIPFQKTDSYIMNKEFSKENEEIFDSCMEKSTAFIENLFNVNYREFMDNKQSFVSDVMMNGNYEAFYTKNIFTEDEKTMLLFEYIEEIADYYIRNQVQMTASFYTDDSLIYKDYYVFTRGELVFTIYNNNDEDCEYEIGKEYHIPMDIALETSPVSDTSYIVCSFGKAGDTTFYLNP